MFGWRPSGGHWILSRIIREGECCTLPAASTSDGRRYPKRAFNQNEDQKGGMAGPHIRHLRSAGMRLLFASAPPTRGASRTPLGNRLHCRLNQQWFSKRTGRSRRTLHLSFGVRRYIREAGRRERVFRPRRIRPPGGEGIGPRAGSLTCLPESETTPSEEGGSRGNRQFGVAPDARYLNLMNATSISTLIGRLMAAMSRTFSICATRTNPTASARAS